MSTAARSPASSPESDYTLIGRRCRAIIFEITYYYTEAACGDGVDLCDDPHMKGLSGQNIDWSGVNGGWYCLVKDDEADLHVNVRLTAPLPEEFPERQLVTGLSVISTGHSVVVEVRSSTQ